MDTLFNTWKSCPIEAVVGKTLQNAERVLGETLDET